MMKMNRISVFFFMSFVVILATTFSCSNNKQVEISTDIDVLYIKDYGAIADDGIDDVRAIKKALTDFMTQLVKEKMFSILDEVDVFVLAQRSMVVLVPELSDIKKPILTSPWLGVQKMRQLLGL